MIDAGSIRSLLPSSFDLYDVADISVFACEGSRLDAGYIIVLDGSVIIPHIKAIVAQYPNLASHMPLFIGVDAADRLSDFTPWPHAAYNEQFHDFGGNSERFIAESLLPIKHALDEKTSGPSGLLGFSLGGLLSLTYLMHPDSFSKVFALSPSVWYPDFYEWVSRTPICATSEVSLFYGLEEGRNRIPPLRDVNQQLQKILAVLQGVPSLAVNASTDRKGHHAGLRYRIEKVLRSCAERSVFYGSV